MVKHIVMWKLHDFAEGRSKAENTHLMKQWLEQLKDKIADVQYLEVGINFKASEDAYDVVLYTEFKDRQALENYQAHPEHIQFKNKIQNLRRDKIVVDYEI
ncbi:MAG: Dabb family protein [candidate division KSB1 bacterium]|nr:Dabb family protein [candidate division KSB1 bacterium]MDZ7334818.1 Dabb family protein [candidate division KSB1 bacterium]MDZ7376957.1 Dabb family protein [candidate division KSB1 bacterium]MDZ7400453.1 Dabb family protein [candidate division KSB1 bacterium]